MAKTNTRRTLKAKPSEITLKEKKDNFKIGVFGAGGRMGQEVLGVLRETYGENSYLAVDLKQQALSAQNIVSDLKSPLCKGIRIWIDFSSPAGFAEIFHFCQKNKMALVSGTTGLTKVQIKAMAKSSIPLLWSPNMSLGINILLKALHSLKGVEGFDLQVEELHHLRKKDKPSGTAILIQNELESLMGTKLERPLSIRGGGIYGIHKVWAMSEEETITFEHQALNRRVFAKGAVQASQWLKKQKPGFYSLQNLLERP